MDSISDEGNTYSFWGHFVKADDVGCTQVFPVGPKGAQLGLNLAKTQAKEELAHHFD